MSWQDYVDNQLLASQCVTKACIAGHDGNIWAQSNGFEVSTECVWNTDRKRPAYNGKLTMNFRKFKGVTHAVSLSRPP